MRLTLKTRRAGCFAVAVAMSAGGMYLAVEAQGSLDHAGADELDAGLTGRAGAA